MTRLAFLLVLGSLLGCAAFPSADGTYVVRNSDFNFQGELVLKTDHTYVLNWMQYAHVISSDKDPLGWSGSESGRWESKDGEVIFTDSRTAKSEKVGRDCVLWGRYQKDGDRLRPVEGFAGYVQLRRTKKEPNQPPEPTR